MSLNYEKLVEKPRAFSIIFYLFVYPFLTGISKISLLVIGGNDRLFAEAGLSQINDILRYQSSRIVLLLGHWAWSTPSKKFQITLQQLWKNSWHFFRGIGHYYAWASNYYLQQNYGLTTVYYFKQIVCKLFRPMHEKEKNASGDKYGLLASGKLKLLSVLKQFSRVRRNSLNSS